MPEEGAPPVRQAQNRSDGRGVPRLEIALALRAHHSCFVPGGREAQNRSDGRGVPRLEIAVWVDV